MASSCERGNEAAGSGGTALDFDDAPGVAPKAGLEAGPDGAGDAEGDEGLPG